MHYDIFSLTLARYFSSFNLKVFVVIYRYRKWDLGDGNAVIVRCEHDAVMHGPKGEEALLNIKTLNEWDSKVL